MCPIKRQQAAIRLVASLAIRVITSNVLDEGVVVGQMQNAAMRALVHLMMVSAVTDVLLKVDRL